MLKHTTEVLTGDEQKQSTITNNPFGQVDKVYYTVHSYCILTNKTHL